MPVPAVYMLGGLAVLVTGGALAASRKRGEATASSSGPELATPSARDAVPSQPQASTVEKVVAGAAGAAGAAKAGASALGSAQTLAAAPLTPVGTVLGGVGVTIVTALAGREIVKSDAGLAAGITPTVGLPAALGFRGTTEVLQAVGVDKRAADAGGVGAAGAVGLAAATGVGTAVAAPLVITAAAAGAVAGALGFGGEPAKHAVEAEKNRLLATYAGREVASAANVQRYRTWMATPITSRGIHGLKGPKAWADHGFAQGKFTGQVLHDGALLFEGVRHAP